MSDFYYQRFTDTVLKLGIGPTNGKIVLQRLNDKLLVGPTKLNKKPS